MPICSPSQNPAIPTGLRVLHENELTPAMQKWAAGYANDVNIPIGKDFRRWWGKLPVVAMVLCHTYTVKPDGTQVPGFYHGVTLFVATSPEWYPDELENKQTDWGLVAVSAGAIAAVTALFFVAIRKVRADNAAVAPVRPSPRVRPLRALPNPLHHPRGPSHEAKLATIDELGALSDDQLVYTVSKMRRREVLAWLEWNDPNGDYEGVPLAELAGELVRQVQDSR